ncbi:UBX domain-containing protein 7-like isoform X2 [Branchiostoma floridae x Branchiostoma japonicum]
MRFDALINLDLLRYACWDFGATMADPSKLRGMDALIEQFRAITDTTEDVARHMLEACGGNLEMAITMHLEGGAGASGGAGPSSTPGASADGAGPSVADDEVRAPIPQTAGVLVEESLYQSYVPQGRLRKPRSVFDGFRDFQAETRQQEQLLRDRVSGKTTAKKRTLEDLFRPPIDLLHKGTFETAKKEGETGNKWLLVNVQNVQEFPCQQLNRDVWSNGLVKSIVQEHFVLWQVYHDSAEGQRYIQFYKVDTFPYIAVLDPRTGERLAEWNTVDPTAFIDMATTFLTDHGALDGESRSPPKKRTKRESIIDASEDSQLEAAIAASLQETEATSGKPDNKTNDSSSESELEITDDESDTFHSVNGESSDDNSDVEVERIVTPDPKDKVQSSNVKVQSSNGHAQTSDSRTEESERTQESSGVEEKVDRSKNGSAVCAKDSTEQQTVTVNGNTTADDDDDDDEGPKTNLMVRFPDGKRKQFSLPASAKLMTLVKLVMSEGYTNERYELVTNFPRRKLSYMDFNVTLEEAGLFPQETIFVQQR